MFGATRAGSIPVADVRRGLVAFFLCTGVWAVLDALFLVASRPPVQSFLSIAALTWGFATVWAWVYFASASSGGKAHRTSTAWVIGGLFFLMVVALKATNPIHGLYFDLVARAQPFPHTGLAPGLLYFMVEAVAYLLAGFGVVLLFPVFRRRASTLSLALLVCVMLAPLAANAAGYLVPDVPRLNYNSIGVAVFAFCVYMIVPRRLVNIHQMGSQEDPAFTLDASGHLTRFNQAFAHRFPQVGETDVVGQALDDVLPALARAYRARHRRVRLLAFPPPTEQPAMPGHAGPAEPRTFHLTRSSVESDPSTRLVVLTDITETERREQQTHDQFAGLMDSLPGVVFQFQVAEDGTYSIPFMSPAAYDQLELPPDANPDKLFPSLLQRVPDTFHEALLRSIDIAIENENSWRSEIPYVLENGTERWLLASSTPRRTGTSLLFNGVLLDITPQKEAERALLRERNQARAARMEAERANQMKSAMLANMSHEIRTPLTSVLGFAEILEEESSGQGQHFAALIRKSAMSLQDTLTAVLTLSRLEADRMDFDIGVIDVQTAARYQLEQFAPDAEAASVTLDGDFQQGCVEADRAAIDIILRNLISNAIKYTPEGGRVTVRTLCRGDQAGIEVEDTGIGMDKDRVSDLIQPFRQASEGFDREYEGVGLGLTLVHRATHALGGDVEIDTAPGEGTTVGVWFRRTEEPDASEREQVT